MRGRREQHGPRTILATQTGHDPILAAGLRYGKYIITLTAVRLKVKENQLVNVFGEIRVRVDGLKSA
jgi:hypothetical protein